MLTTRDRYEGHRSVPQLADRSFLERNRMVPQRFVEHWIENDLVFPQAALSIIARCELKPQIDNCASLKASGRCGSLRPPRRI